VCTFYCTMFTHLHLPSSTGASPPPRAGLVPLSCSLILQEKKEKIKGKTWHFEIEIKVATQGVSLWYFYVCMNYNPTWFFSSNFLYSTLVWWRKFSLLELNLEENMEVNWIV
jgi:hypothetical protein